MFQVLLITKKGKKLELPAERLTIETVVGQETLLTNHMPIKLVLQTGRGYIKQGEQKSVFFHSAGLLRFEENQATLLLEEWINETELTTELIQEKLADPANNAEQTAFWQFCFQYQKR